jgi:hypothetical protein
MREIQVQAAPATLDLLLKRLPGFECSKRSAPASELADPIRIGKIEPARQGCLEIRFKEGYVPALAKEEGHENTVAGSVVAGHVGKYKEGRNPQACERRHGTTDRRLEGEAISGPAQHGCS